MCDRYMVDRKREKPSPIKNKIDASAIRSGDKMYRYFREVMCAGASAKRETDSDAIKTR